jgi:L-alanine-DL-glutamate epimerase-like enolase superfamily enzyme
MSASLCATLSNVRIMEIDVDDVPWKDELVTNPPEIKRGYMTIPKGPGLGTAVNEEVARAHAWDPHKSSHQKNIAPARSY